MRVAILLFAVVLASTPFAVAQQNQTPGDLNAGGSSGGEGGGSKASKAQAGANTTDGTTTGSSGPKPKQNWPPGNLALPPLPSPELCNAYTGPVQSACLATATEAGSLNGGLNDQ